MMLNNLPHKANRKEWIAEDTSAIHRRNNRDYQGKVFTVPITPPIAIPFQIITMEDRLNRVAMNNLIKPGFL